MKRKLQNKLYRDFPSLFKEKDLSKTETCMCWGISTGNGWYKLIRNTCKELMKTDGSENLKFVQVKEKFGGLRLYTGRATEEQYKIIGKAEGESYKTCEWCGRKNNVETTGGWLATLCPRCTKKRNTGYRPWMKTRDKVSYWIRRLITNPIKNLFKGVNNE